MLVPALPAAPEHPKDAAVERAGFAAVGVRTSPCQGKDPFPRSQSHWAVRSRYEKILVRGNFGSLWTDTKSQTHKNFSQVGNFASY